MHVLKKGLLILSFTLPLYVVSHSAFAVHKAFAVYSPYCQQKTIIKVAGDALINISKVQFSKDLHSYNVTLDTQKMTFQDLIKKMEAEGCYIE